MTAAKARTATAVAPLTFDEILDQGVPNEERVPLCFNGRIRRDYEEVAARIEARREDRDAARLVAESNARQAAAAAAEPSADDRLGVKRATPDEAAAAALAGLPDEATFVDPEQDTADRLLDEMKRYTVVFVLHAIGPKWNEILEQHPPRKDPADAKKNDPRDWEGVNSSTFYTAMVRASLTSPQMTDERWDKLLNGPARLSDMQFDRLADAAKRVNRQDEDLPFSLGDLESPPS